MAWLDSAPPELAPQMRQIAALRSELRALRGALDSQRPRMVEANRVVRESASLRSDLALLGSSLDARRRSLNALRSSQEDLDGLAETVAAAARDASETLRSDRQRAERRAATTASNAAMPALPALPAPPQDRDAMLRAARDRMRRRGVGHDAGLTGGGTSVAPIPGERSEGTMFDRLRLVRDASERAERAILDAVQGAPKVQEIALIRTLADDCSICLEQRKRGQEVWILQCGHCFHKKCAQRWLAGACTCPLCKRPVERHKVGDEPPSTVPSASASASG